MAWERLDYSHERKRHASFVGRAATMAQLDRLLLEDDVDRWVVITGGPGMGKSALLAEWLARREAGGVVVPHHFIRRAEYGWADPATFVGSLVAQLGDRAELRDLVANVDIPPAAYLGTALTRVSEHTGARPGDRIVVVIDGLDEYDPPEGAGSDPFAAFLPLSLPRGVSMLCSTRPRYEYVANLKDREGEFAEVNLDHSSSAADNEATVRAVWERVRGPLELSPQVIERAVALANGNVQHAVTLQRYLQGLPPERRSVESSPPGLDALLERTWLRIAADPVVAQGLGILCAAQEAITLEELGTVAAWTASAQRAFVSGAAEWLLETSRHDGQFEYQLHHESIRAHVANAVGPLALRGHHSALAERLACWPPPNLEMARRYALRHALSHRADAADWWAAWRIAANTTFLEAKCRELTVDEAAADVARIAVLCQANGHGELHRCFDELSRALARDSDWLRTAPEQAAGIVWNRLRRAGWSAKELDSELRMPAAATFLRVRNVATRESPALRQNFVCRSGSLDACAVTADGRRAIAAADDGTLEIWDLKHGRQVAVLKAHTGGVTACAVTPDQQRVISASEDGTLKVWDLHGGNVLATLTGHTRGVRGCAIVPDGKRIVSASSDRTLKIWNIESGVVLATLEGHEGDVNACAVTADGLRVVSASNDRTVRLWDLETGRMLATLQGHDHKVTGCAVTADGRRVVSASSDRTLKVWDLESHQALVTMRDHYDTVTACAVTPDGGRVVSASADWSLKLWDLESGQPLDTLRGHDRRVNACAITADGRRVLSASEDGTLKLWDLERGHRHALSGGHAKPVSACAVTLNGRRAITASQDEMLRIWEVERGRSVANLEGHTGWVRACAIMADSRRAVSASADLTLKVWDLKSRRELKNLLGHTGGVNACAVTPDGRCVVSGSNDGTLRVWDVERARTLAVLRGHVDRVNACAITPDGKHVVSASTDGTLKVWDLRGGRALETLRDHSNGVSACTVTPDGKCVISASADNTLKVWDLSNGRVIATLKGHTGWVLACAVTSEGQNVISASIDRTLKVWDLETYACVATHCGDASYNAIAASPTTIIAGDDGGAVWFFDWPILGRTIPEPRHRNPSVPRKRPKRNQRNAELSSIVDAGMLTTHGGATDIQFDRGRLPGSGMNTYPGPVPQTHATSRMAAPKVDIAIITMRDDEFRAVLDVFPTEAGRVEGADRLYNLRHADAGNGGRYTVAVLRQAEQGTGEAQHVARDLVEDLRPKLVIVVGIAGGLPSNDVKLGDVVLSTRIHDFTLEARKFGEPTEYAVTGGPIVKALRDMLANLAAREGELGDWTADLPPQPAVTWMEKGQLYGPRAWRHKLREKLAHHYGEQARPRGPSFVAGPIASSDRLVKDPEVLPSWIAAARNLLAVETESGGVLRATGERCPMLAIRGISDIVGLKRSEAWTKFACAAAAAFTRAFLRMQPVPVSTSVAALFPLRDL